MVSALQALSVTIAGALSSAGWLYFSPAKDKNDAMPITENVPFFSPPAFFQGSFGFEENHSPPSIEKKTTPLREYEFLIKPILEWVQPNSIVEVELSDADITTLHKGKWLVFVYADWCPHSRAYIQVWRELINRFKISPPKSPPTFASLSVSANPGLAAALDVNRLPSFIVLDNGLLFGTVTSVTFEDLLDVASTDWQTVKTKRKRLPKIAPKMGRLNMQAFDFLSHTAIRTQEVIIDWINRDKLVAYTFFILIGAVTYFGCKRGYLDII